MSDATVMSVMAMTLANIRLSKELKAIKDKQMTLEKARGLLYASEFTIQGEGSGVCVDITGVADIEEIEGILCLMKEQQKQ